MIILCNRCNIYLIKYVIPTNKKLLRQLLRKRSMELEDKKWNHEDNWRFS